MTFKCFQVRYVTAKVKIQVDQCNIFDFYPHMHKMGPWGPKYYIFGDRFFTQKCQNAQIPCIPPF